MLKLLLLLLSVSPSMAVTREVGSGQTHTTIQGCLNAASAGDVCNVHAGTYTEQLTLPASGSSGNVITLRNHPGATVTVQSTSSPVLSIASRSYWTISGITFRYTGSGSAPKIINQNFSGVGVNPINGLTFQNCILQLEGGTGSGFGIYIPNSDALTISGVTVAVTASGGSHDGMDLLYASNLTITASTIYGNSSESTGRLEDGIVVTGTTISIYDNVLHDGWSYDNHPDGIVVQGDGDRSGNPTADVSVYRNTIYNFTQGIYYDAIHDPLGGNNVIHSNVLYETADFRYGGSAGAMNCIVLDGERLEGAPHYSVAAKVYNNTTDCGQTHLYINRTGTGTVIDVQNNIFSAIPFTGVYISSTTGVTMDYNYYSAANGTPIKWGSANYSLSGYKSAQSPNEANSTAGTAGLQADYTISASADARNKGANLSAYLSVDRAGVSRPSAGAWDAGAYVYRLPTTRLSGIKMHESRIQ